MIQEKLKWFCVVDISQDKENNLPKHLNNVAQQEQRLNDQYNQ